MMPAYFSVFTRFCLVLSCTLLLSACLGGGTEEAEDGDAPVYRPETDGDDSASDGDLPLDGDVQPWEDGDGESAPDGDDPDGDIPDGDGTDSDTSDGDTDGDEPDGDGEEGPDGDRETDDDGSSFGFCTALEDCPVDEICQFSLARCEPRSTLIDLESGFYSFHPLSGTSGDKLVIDGRRFFFSMVGNFSVKVWIGQTQLAFVDYIGRDENRLLVRVPDGAAGTIGIECEGGAFFQSRSSFTQSATGVLACDSSSPAASGTAGSSPTSMGPYAAGYLDTVQNNARIYYPAQCGSIRRPGTPGEYPLVAMLHGNGAGHINYEYLAQLLASWGFVVVNPASIHTNEYDEAVIQQLYNDIAAVHDQDLSALHPALAGLSTSGEIAFMGHSRGCGRMQELFGDYPAMAGDTVASVFLGPANNDTLVPGLFMAIGATEDGQSFPFHYNGQYDRQSAPKWKVILQGGNHSLFADAKIYFSFDGVPTLTRHRQLSIVASFVIPLLQRAFGQTEPFAAWLDTPPVHPDYTVTSDSSR